jgi:protein SCO1
MTRHLITCSQTNRTTAAPAVALVLCLVGWGVAPAAYAQSSVLSQRGGETADFVPPVARETGVTQNIGAQLPLDLAFVDTRGEAVTLDDYFGRSKPLLVTFNYSNCPQLCSLQLVGLVDALRELKLTVGEEFEMLTISIDPSETTERAALTQNRYFDDYQNAGDARTKDGERHTARRAAALEGTSALDFGWHFLTGDEAAIAAVTDAAGYAFNLDPDTGEYAHDAVVLVVTPDGTVSRYLPGVFYEPNDVDLALIGASNGELGGIVAWTRMFCYRWDPEAGSYVRSAERMMLLGAGGSALLLLAFMGLMWRNEFKKSKRAANAGAAPTALASASASH